MNRMVFPISWGPLAVTLTLITAVLSSIGCIQSTLLGGGDGGGTGGASMTTSGAGCMSGTGGTGGTGGGGTGGALGGTGGGAFCLAPGDCSGVDDACQSRTCVQGQCGHDYAPSGTLLPIQTAGDCKADVCDGSGATIAVIDDSDVADDSDACTEDVCTAGVPSNPIKPQWTTCGMGLVCDSNGQCVVAEPQFVYSTSFEGACPDGWTLSGDWECGVPMNVGPAAAFAGTQCLATQIDANHQHNQTFATATADSPDIDLTGAISPKLTFRMWVDTEGMTYDGFNLQLSSDGGISYSVINSVMPAYPLTIAGKPAWGGHLAALGWQLVEADLSAYAGQIVRLRFAFRSDGSTTYPGIYIDDILIN